MRRSSERGQVITQNVVLAGIMVTITIAILSVLFLPVRETFRNIATCIISDVCKEGGDAERSSQTGGDTTSDLPTACGMSRNPEPCNKGNCWAQVFRDVGRWITGGWNRTKCGALPGLEGFVIGGTPGFWTGFTAGFLLCDGRTQDWKGLDKRKECCCCGKTDECDGTTAQIGSVTCILNDSDGPLSDALETQAMIDDVSRMINGGKSQITENDAVKSVKASILAALEPRNSKEPIELIGHSQGAAVISVAVWQLYRSGEVDDADLRRLQVAILGPAEWRFPPSVDLSIYINRGPDSQDPVPPAMDRYRQSKFAPLPELPEEPDEIYLTWPCSGLTCHDARAYLEAHARIANARDPSPPATTIIVNGIMTEAEDREGLIGLLDRGSNAENCRCYQNARSGGSCSSMGKNATIVN